MMLSTVYTTLVWTISFLFTCYAGYYFAVFGIVALPSRTAQDCRPAFCRR